MKYRGNISSRYSGANTSELLENLKETFHRLDVDHEMTVWNLSSKSLNYHSYFRVDEPDIYHVYLERELNSDIIRNTLHGSSYNITTVV